MKLLTMFIVSALSVGLLIGCSDDDNGPTGGNETPQMVDTTFWDSGQQNWVSMVDASTSAALFSFGDTSTTKTGAALDWHLAFDRTKINTNGGDFGDGGDCRGTDLGVVNFDDVTIDDTTGVTWVEDEDFTFFQDTLWYNYNPISHSFDLTGNVFAMVDAEADNFVKFTVDSMVGAGMPPQMGTVFITYYYQPNAGSRDISGATQIDSVIVGAGIGYYDFSSSSQVYPSNPDASTNWDIKFSSYSLTQNSGPNGPGNCAAYPMYGDLTDPTDISEATAVPAMAPLFPDFTRSVFYADPNNDNLNWYDYQPSNNHRIVSWGRVYLISTEGKVFKAQIVDYYNPGTGTSGFYTFHWNEL